MVQNRKLVKARLKRMRYRADLIEGFFARTGLALDLTGHYEVKVF